MNVHQLENEVDQLEYQINALKEGILRENGWKLSCDHPGAAWLWTKEINGKTYACSVDTALYIQRALR